MSDKIKETDPVMHYWPDLKFVAVVWHTIFIGSAHHNLNYRVFQTNGQTSDGKPNFDDWIEANQKDASQFVMTKESSEYAFVYGTIKYDGCMNFDFPEHDTMRHVCGREEAVAIGEVFNRLYAMALAIQTNGEFL